MMVHRAQVVSTATSSLHPVRAKETRQRLARWFVFLLCVFCSVPSSFAADDGGGTESIFKLGPTARGVGLGSAMVGLAFDASAPYWNPALLPHARGSELTFSYNRLYGQAGGASYGYLGLAYPTLNAGGFGIGILRLKLGEIETYDTSSRPTGTIDYGETQLLLSYGYGGRLPYVGGRLDLGLSAKIHSLDLAEKSTSGGMDLGLAWTVPRLSGTRLCFVYQNLIAPSFRLIEREDKLPSTKRFALSKRHEFNPSTSVEVAAVYDSPQYADHRVGLGAEAEYLDLYTLRLSYDDGHFNAGLGGRWRDYALDYAFRSGGELGSSQFLSLSWYFGEDIEDRRSGQAELRAQELAQARLEAVEIWRKDQIHGAVEDFRTALDQESLEAAEAGLARARSLGAAEDSLASDLRRLQELKQRKQRIRDDEQRRTLRIEDTETQLEAALRQGDAQRARTELNLLAKLAADHPMLPRFVQQVEDLEAGSIASASSEATAAEEAGDWESALNAWSVVASLDPSNPAPAAALKRWKAELDAARNQSNRAETDAARARRELAQEKRFSSALQEFAQGKLDEAETLCRQVLTVEPGHSGAKGLLNQIAHRRSGPSNLSPQQQQQVRAYYLSGLRSFTDGDYAAAIVQWRRILTIDPGNQGAQNNIAEAQARIERLEANPGAKDEQK